ncbi:MAG: oligopeptide:H+ symporter, partial [Gammaproteobacteria bacterium]|nr:oligopeptide:H+ symporter [Gammaproteobacteria bacterium]
IGPLHFDSWHLAFGLSAIGLTLGLLNYGVFQHYLRPYGTAPDFERINWRKFWLVMAASILIVGLLTLIIQHPYAAVGVVVLCIIIMIYVFSYLLLTNETTARRRVIACIVFTGVSVVWAVYNQQIYTSLTLFALRNVNHDILGLHVSPAQFQDLNQFWLVLLAMPLAWLYQRMQKTRRGDFSMAVKYTAGMYLLALAFFLYAAGGFSAQAGTVSSWWLVAGYAAQSLGELLISALGFSMVSQLVPERSRGIVMGAWFLGMGVSNYLGGAIASLASIPAGVTHATDTLPYYLRLFAGLSAGALVCAIVMTAIIPLLNKLVGTQKSTDSLIGVN